MVFFEFELGLELGLGVVLGTKKKNRTITNHFIAKGGYEAKNHTKNRVRVTVRNRVKVSVGLG